MASKSLNEQLLELSDEKQWPEPVSMTKFECQQMSSELFAKLGTMILYKDTKKHMDKINAYRDDIKQCIRNTVARIDRESDPDMGILWNNLNILLSHVKKTFK